jgi:Tfp pilus assembly protein PilO
VKVTSREKMVIIIGACIAAVILISYAVLTLDPVRDLAQNVELKKKSLRNQRENLLREDIYKKRLEQCNKQLNQDMMRLLPGDNTSLAGAELQKVIKNFADQAGVEITQRNILPEKKVQDIATKVSIRIETNCTPEQLIQFLAAIENYEKMLTIDEMMIAAIRLPKKAEIRPSLTISGYIQMQPEKLKEKAAARPGGNV